MVPITADSLDTAFVSGKPTCEHLSQEQKELKKKYFRGYIPHVVVSDASASAVCNHSGEVRGRQ